MAAKWPSWIFISTQYLKNHLSNRFEDLQIHCYILDKGQVQFRTLIRNPIWPPGGHLGFRFCLISQEGFEHSVLNFAYLLVYIRRRSSSILDSIRNPIWPQVVILDFRFCLISKKSPLNLQFKILQI